MSDELRVIGSVTTSKGERVLVVDLPNTYPQCINCMFMQRRLGCGVISNGETTCHYPLWSEHNVVFTPSLEELAGLLVARKIAGEIQ